MTLTRDGYNLEFDDECLRVVLGDDSSDIREVVKCVYKGFFVQDNRPLLASLSLKCSGMPIPESQLMYRFEDVSNKNTQFDLCAGEIRCSIIKDTSSIERVSKLRFKT